MILALTLVAALNPWAELAVRDVEAMRAQIEANHPGPVDTLNPGFRKWLDGGYQQALAKAREAKSFGGYDYALRYYGAGFRDGHLQSGVMLYRAELWWPRFLVRLRNGRYVVAAVADDQDAALPPVGSELLDCDGRSARTIVEQDIWPYQMGPMIESTWPAAAAELFIDRGNPWAPRARTCRFRMGEETKPIALHYVRSNDSAVSAVARKTVVARAPLPPARRINDKTVWVSIPSFVAVNEETGARLRELVQRAPEWRDAELVVFDVRGNDGGNSSWGTDLVRALYGREFDAAAIEPAFAKQYVDWRVSKDNLAHLREIVSDLERTGASSLSYFKSVHDGMAKALAEGKPMFRLPDEPSSPPANAEPQFRGKVVLLTDRRCASACLDFADRVRLLPNAKHFGQATNADSVYMEVRPVDLPSGIGRLGLPVKVYRNRPRGHNEPYVPHVAYEGDINDTAALEKWILDVMR